MTTRTLHDIARTVYVDKAYDPAYIATMHELPGGTIILRNTLTGATLTLADDFSGPATDAPLPFDYATYSSTETLELGEYDHLSGGTTEAEAHQVITDWFLTHITPAAQIAA